MFSNKRVDTLCESCQLGKLSKLPFNSSSSVSTDIIKRIHCDIWGPAPVLSLGKFRFYACFVDDYSHYMWIIPLRTKSDFFYVYLTFEHYVQRQFNKKIKIFHTDGGGEFVNKRLESHFQQQGIIHHLSCPYTPEQTWIVERQHCTIRELGMTMIFHSGVPKFLWIEAFATTVFLINRLPSSSLAFDTPYSRLYGSHPNYSTLRVFGSRCYPYTWNTKRNKFDAKIVPCIFVGYSNQHKGYRCLDLKTHRMFLSRHVVFDENHFPCRKKENQPSSHTSSTKSFGIFPFLPTVINTVPPVDAPSCNPLHESSTPLVPVVEMFHLIPLLIMTTLLHLNN